MKISTATTTSATSTTTMLISEAMMEDRLVPTSEEIQTVLSSSSAFTAFMAWTDSGSVSVPVKVMSKRA